MLFAFKGDGKMEYITSVNNPKIKQVGKLLSSAKHRREEGLFVLEGLRLCMDLVRTGLQAEELFYTEEAYQKSPKELDELMAISSSIYPITNLVATKLTDTKNPQGVVCVVRSLDKQEGRNKIDKTSADGKYILLENVQDPANLGAISRTAEALGITGLIVSGGCDVYSPKALRASMGALLRIPVLLTDDIPTTLKQAETAGLKTYASTPSTDAVSIAKADFRGGVLCVIGNEANGVTDETLAGCQERITIPMAGRAESLNAGAAASILMWEMVNPNETTEL